MPVRGAPGLSHAIPAQLQDDSVQLIKGNNISQPLPMHFPCFDVMLEVESQAITLHADKEIGKERASSGVGIETSEQFSLGEQNLNSVLAYTDLAVSAHHKTINDAAESGAVLVETVGIEEADKEKADIGVGLEATDKLTPSEQNTNTSPLYT
jgi:hypothetical protein